jgi:hypothetical protein
MADRGRTMIPSTTHHPPASSLLYEFNQHDRVISSLVLINTHTYVNEGITDMMSAGPFVAGLKCSGNVFWGFSSFTWQRGTLQIIAVYLITLHNILEYMQIATIQTEAANFENIYSCDTNILGIGCYLRFSLCVFLSLTTDSTVGRGELSIP